jgi:nucleoside-diphosphate-sugar epimerase
MTDEGLRGKTVLVTGATGFVGSALCRRLSDLGITTKALARREGRDRYIRDLPHVDIVMGNITDAERMEVVMESVNIVFHVAAALSGDIHHQRRVNVEGTRHIMEAAHEQGVERVVHVSSIAVFGYEHPTGKIDERQKPTPSAEAYSLSKAEAEDVVVTLGEKYALPYTIVRPGGIYGAHSALWTTTMFKLATRKPFIFVGDGRGLAPLIYIDDLIDLLIISATHPSAKNQAYNACYDPAYTWDEYLGAYARLKGEHRWRGLPIGIIKPILQFVSLFAPAYSQLKIAPQAIGFLAKPIHVEAQKAKQDLNWRPKTTLQEGIQACVPYLRDKGLLA